MRQNIGTIALLVIGALVLAGAAYCLVVIATFDDLSPRESGLLGFVLFVLSVLATWFFSHVYASLSNRATIQEKINTIAVQSSEKILNLSVQLWRLEQFVAAALEDSEAAPNEQAVISTLRNRLISATWLARALRSSNNTFLSDWKGVVSPDVRHEIENQVRAQADIIEAYEEIDQARAERGPHADDMVVAQRIDEVLRRIEKQRSRLPAAAAPDRPATPPPAVSTSQHPGKMTPELSDGTLEIRLLRPVFNFTGSGRLEPEMSAKPVVWAEIASSPDGTGEITVRAGTGTTFDFNVHVKSTQYGVRLQPGIYTVRYRAAVKKNEDSATSDVEEASDPTHDA